MYESNHFNKNNKLKPYSISLNNSKVFAPAQGNVLASGYHLRSSALNAIHGTSNSGMHSAEKALIESSFDRTNAKSVLSPLISP
jgi:hypothetical protein